MVCVCWTTVRTFPFSVAGGLFLRGHRIPVWKTHSAADPSAMNLDHRRVEGCRFSQRYRPCKVHADSFVGFGGSCQGGEIIICKGIALRCIALERMRFYSCIVSQRPTQ